MEATCRKGATDPPQYGYGPPPGPSPPYGYGQPPPGVAETGYGLPEGLYGPPYYGPPIPPYGHHAPLYPLGFHGSAGQAPGAVRIAPPPPTSRGFGYPQGFGFCTGLALSAPPDASVTQQQQVRVHPQGGDGSIRGDTEKKRKRKGSQEDKSAKKSKKGNKEEKKKKKTEKKKKKKRIGIRGVESSSDSDSESSFSSSSAVSSSSSSGSSD
jgi:hypothetical protein